MPDTRTDESIPANRSAHKNKTAARVLTGLLIALLLCFQVLACVWVGLQRDAIRPILSGGQDSVVLPVGSASVLVLYPDHHPIQAGTALWTARALRTDGVYVESLSVSSSPDRATVDYIKSEFSGLPGGQGNTQDNRWIVAVGHPADWSVDLALQLRTANLVLINPVGITEQVQSDPVEGLTGIRSGLEEIAPSADFEWLKWAGRTAEAWPDDKKLVLVSAGHDQAAMRSLFEMLSGEDAWLFAGYDSGRGNQIELWQSLDARFTLSVIPLGAVRLPWLSSAFAGEASAAITNYTIPSMQESDQSDSEAIWNSGRQLNRIRLITYLAILSFLFLQPMMMLFWLLQAENKSNGSTLSYPVRLPLLAVAGIVSIGLLSLSLWLVLSSELLPALQWWLLIPAGLLLCLVQLPEAIIGTRLWARQTGDPEIETDVEGPVRSSGKRIRIVSNLLFLFWLLPFVPVALIFLILNPGQPDTWIWIAAGSGLLLISRLTVRLLAAASGDRKSVV